MPAFLDENFMLHSPSAQKLYHIYGKTQPIFDFHCHLNPREIFENKPFKTITQVWLSGDHYKWRLMRACGIDEYYITGQAPDDEKFFKWAETIEKSIGNPLYVWTHMELSRYFGINELLTARSAPSIFEACNQKLASTDFCPRGLILKSGITALCTTDDPIDSLTYHQALKEDKDFPVQVLPAFRPETALHPEQAQFCQWIETLAALCGHPIETLDQLERALEVRAAFFKTQGCHIADQSLLSPDFTKGTRSQAEAAFKKAVSGKALEPEEENAYQTQLMLSLGKLYHKMGFVMQLHFGVLRNCNTRLFSKVGADAGFDAVGDGISAHSVAVFFDKLDRTKELPPTVIYSLNACDDDKLCSVLGCFQEGQFPQKMQLGAPWWFSDHEDGMRKQMKALANTGLLSGFIGMLTDSRSFLSYVRHDYFRRVLCDLLGNWMEQGDIPAQADALGTMVQAICFQNAAHYFGLPTT